ncbi:hypothetical protein BWQ96_01469 [Gracilariopsis chorda]|uniref:DUF2272 domain-containing protein n=1 Tax=Gracilariopsis chorda TaxID=448386 RepID=A0A2V3J3P7_9FLOR|nr:hypothetical protein BWQ96_01469 [Gracilariopsis chorda]|eukprot:PXF48617.1 hypothetical protein BWQ96_01469 [Gracilariopsis chorda]
MSSPLTFFLSILLLHIAFAANYCGTSFGDARKCQTSCPRGLDGECPGSERCFASVTCSSTPTTAPGPATGFAADIVSTTNAEYNTYGNLHECFSPTMARRVGDYWDELGLNLDGCDRNVPWSAAFISYMVREAGGGTNFRYSSAHRDYIHDAFAGGRGLYNSVSNIDSSTVRTGDLACSGRGRIGSWDYSDFLTWYNNGGTSHDTIPTHCDIVVAVSGSTITVIGGNVSQRVTRNTVSKTTYAVLLPVTR